MFFAGGQDDAGATDTVEMWLPSPNIKRRGEPEFAMSFSGRDRGGLVCGGRLVLAGGHGGVGAWSAADRQAEAAADKPWLRSGVTTSKRRRSPPKPKPKKSKLYATVDVWMANLSGPVLGAGAGGSPGVKPQQVYKLSAPVALPNVVCLAERYVLIAGGHPAKGCYDSAVHVLDLDAPPAPGGALPLLPQTLNSTATSYAAVSNGTAAIFFNGQSADVFSLST